MKKLTFTFLFIFSYSLLFSQALEVELPKRLDYIKYWKWFKSNHRFELDFNDITKSNNEYWRNKADLRYNTGKYQKQHWNHLTKQIKYIEESIYKNKEVENNEIEYLNTYRFDSFGKILEKVQSNNQGDWKVKEVFKYNEHQNIIEYSKYKLSSYTDNKYELEEKQTFKYNEKQQLVIKNGDKPQTIVYSYNDKGLLSKIKHFGYASDSYSDAIAYSSEISKEDLEKYENELKNKALIEYTFEYDSRGNKILEKKENVEKKEIVYAHVYEYNKENLLSKFSTANYIFEYRYTNFGMLQEELLIDTETNQILKSTNTYNDSRQLVSTTSPGEYGNTIYQKDFKYADDKIIQEENFEIIYNQKKLFYVSDLEYDENNRLVKCIYFDENRWIENYDYDTLGRLLKYTRTSTIEDKTYNNYRYSYDENGGIIESIWNELIKRKIEYY